MKLFVIRTLRVFMRIFYVFPVKRNRINFSVNRGKSISCNPKYIYEYMKENFPGEYEYIWECETDNVNMGEDTKVVKPGSIKSLYYLMTSKVIIRNDGLGSYIPKRNSQFFINTWHGGGAYKRVGAEVGEENKTEVIIQKMCGEQTDMFVSSSKAFSKVMAGSKSIHADRFFEVGMPRNDFLIRGTEADIRGKVLKYFNLSGEKKLVLFAPTYRGTEADASFDAEIDIEKCLNALERRFGGKWVFLMRKHHFVKSVQNQGCIDASGYPDMQELLYSVDAFITDYSSSIWDYSLTFKPGFLFVPDLSQYTSERNFYTDPETWAFPLAQTNEELETLICSYDEEQNSNKIKAHHQLLESKETGCATKILVEKINKICGGK